MKKYSVTASGTYIYHLALDSEIPLATSRLFAMKGTSFKRTLPHI